MWRSLNPAATRLHKNLHRLLKRKTPMQVWNEYYQSLSTDKQLSAQLSEDMSRVLECADTRLALDRSGDTANFDYRLMNETNSEKYYLHLINLSNL